MITATKPFVLVQSEDSTEPSVSVFGRTDTTAIVIDWEDVQFDPERANALIFQIQSHYQAGVDPDDGIKSVVDRLKEIANPTPRRERPKAPWAELVNQTIRKYLKERQEAQKFTIAAMKRYGPRFKIPPK